MTTKEAVKFFGTVQKLADALNIKQPAVSQWGEYPPIPRQYQIQVLTKNKLKAE
jgi:hypothetical protein